MEFFQQRLIDSLERKEQKASRQSSRGRRPSDAKPADKKRAKLGGRLLPEHRLGEHGAQGRDVIGNHRAVRVQELHGEAHPPRRGPTGRNPPFHQSWQPCDPYVLVPAYRTAR